MLDRFRLHMLSLMLFLAAGIPAAADDGFVDLFNGKSLEGWVQRGGLAKYRVEDGTIVGQTVPNTSNSYLCTRQNYRDFVLEYEFKCDDQLNSGVQFRSAVYDKETTIKISGEDRTFPADRVHGYQCEIDPDPKRSWTSGIYEERGRGWLYPGLRGGDAGAFTKQGQKMYKQGQWNSVRIVCRGDHIQSWLNGQPRADLRDGLADEGFFGLQVHGVGGREDPLEVRWRNIRIKSVNN